MHLIWGAEDGFVSPALGEGLVERIPDTRLDVISGAGHYPQLECPDETMAALTGGPCGAENATVGG